MATIQWTLTRGSEEADIEVSVWYEVEPYVPARISGPPEDCYPAEGGGITDMRVTKAGTDEEVEITDDERKQIEDHIYLTHDYNDDGRDPDAEYEARRDDAMDRRDDWSGEDW